MPKKLHHKLAKAARKAGLRPGTAAYNAYVYGTMQKIEAARKKKHHKKRR